MKRTNDKKCSPFTVRVKVWTENAAGDVVVGMGRVKMLESIGRNGSISGAAAEMSMSYRDLWGRLLEMEKRLGNQLLIRAHGGARGGGTQLTPFAVNLIRQFHEYHSLLESEAVQLFQPLNPNP